MQRNSETLQYHRVPLRFNTPSISPISNLPTKLEVGCPEEHQWELKQDEDRSQTKPLVLCFLSFVIG